MSYLRKFLFVICPWSLISFRHGSATYKRSAHGFNLFMSLYVTIFRLCDPCKAFMSVRNWPWPNFINDRYSNFAIKYVFADTLVGQQ